MATEEEARELWQKYYMLSQELLKFMGRENIDEFLELVNQRTQILDELEALPDTEYRKTAECQALFEKIKPLDMQTIYKAKSWLNRSKRKNMAVRSYDVTGEMPLGNVFNRKY